MYGDKRNYPKIDIYHVRNGYVCSTTWARTCAEAVDRFAERRHIKLPAIGYYARFAR